MRTDTAPGCSGYSLIELVFVAGLVATLSAVAIPQLLAALDGFRALGAAHYVSARLQRTRSEAVMRSADVAMRFVRGEGGYQFAVYVDGNRNGVRGADIDGGIDRRLGAVERLGDSFTGIDFGAIPDLPPVEEGGVAPEDDPIRLGATDGVTFTAMGTATTGSLYIRSRRGAQYVIRIFGVTGKTRILQFNAHTSQWMPL
jgi:type II secretory pathway pseudopilin PulG